MYGRGCRQSVSHDRGQQPFSPGLPSLGHPQGPAAWGGGGGGAARLPRLRMALLLAGKEQSGFILSSQMLVMLPTFLFTEVNSKHLFFFKFSDMRQGEVHFCTAPNPKYRPALAWWGCAVASCCRADWLSPGSCAGSVGLGGSGVPWASRDAWKHLCWDNELWRTGWLFPLPPICGGQPDVPPAVPSAALQIPVWL